MNSNKAIKRSLGKLKKKKDDNQNVKGIQTISSMFKRQQQASLCDKSLEDSDDVSIVAVSSTGEPCDKPMSSTSKRRRLSLRRKSSSRSLLNHELDKEHMKCKSVDKPTQLIVREDYESTDVGLLQVENDSVSTGTNTSTKILNHLALEKRSRGKSKDIKELARNVSNENINSSNEEEIERRENKSIDQKPNEVHDVIDGDVQSAVYDNKGTECAVSDSIRKESENADRSGPEVKEADGKRNLEDGIDAEIAYVPYYLQNFNSIIDTVLADTDNQQLFSEKDMLFVDTFQNLAESAKKLFVRIFCRKFCWLPLNKLKYPEISSDITEVTSQLVEGALLITDEELEDLETTLNLLPSPDLKSLAKSFHVKVSGVSKSQAVESLLDKSRHSTVGSMFLKTGGGLQQTMLKRAKKILGRSFKLDSEARGVFIRLLMLYSLVNMTTDEDSGSGGQNQLFQMLLVNQGKVVYPSYTTNKKTRIFQNRDSVIELEKALQYETTLMLLEEQHDYEKAYDVYRQIQEHWMRDETVVWDRELPPFLRRYSAGHVYNRLLRHGVDIIQHRKHYREAVELLRQLLTDEVYGSDHRGYCWDRLALNLDIHLKSQQESLKAIEAGLSDLHVTVGYRLALYQRAMRICKSERWKGQKSKFHHDDVIDAPKCYVEGKVLSHSIPGARYKFMLEIEDESAPEDVTMCSVEELALQYYRNNGFPQEATVSILPSSRGSKPNFAASSSKTKQTLQAS
ncbi:hypothetical protein ScPMuIL_018868 [Solemya velum]